MPDNTPIRIKKLSPLLINQLAAGEVVTRPAAVVKELLENAIDAGATHIEVRITQGGMSMIEVSDNGTGIHPDDMVMAITRHATSKVADIANLQGITTLGFRGEALAATAAVSRLSLVSSHDDSGIGRQLHVAGILSELPTLTPVVRTQGTTVTVKDLYFNVPARRGNLKSMATEFGHIESIVRDVALACADVSLDLFHDNKKRLSLLAASGCQKDQQKSRLPLSRLEQALGRGLSAHAHAISVDLSSLITDAEHTRAQDPISAQITGWIWTSNESTPPQLIYVNGRLIKEVLIVNELRKLAARFLLERLGYALYFELPASWLNVNVHPSKQRIKISPLNNVMAHLTHSVSSLLTHTQPAQNQTSSKTSVLPQPPTDAPVVGNQDAVQAARPRSIKLSDYKVDQSPPSPPRSARPQVAAPRQRYQASDSDHSSSAIALDAKASDSIPHEPPPPDWRDRVMAALPQCIAVITTLPAAAASLDLDNQAKDMPWLLFSHQGQLMLTAQSTWQANAATVFERSWPVAKGSVTVTKIHQQMAHASAQTTNQDGDNVIAALADVLSVSAIACITTEQLVALMLSSSTL